MQLNYKPASQLERFGLRVFNILAKNHKQTFFVGGMIRDLLLKRKITDVDITTQARPEEIISLLKKRAITSDAKHKNFGVILAKQNNFQVEITTLRSEVYGKTRFPKVKFISSSKQDSKRRDFTINALYLRPDKKKIYDFNSGLADIKNKLIRFIGPPDKRIKEDSLRILRSLRFALVLKCRLEPKTKFAIKNNFSTLKTVSQTKMQLEMSKLESKQQRAILQKVINSPGLIDKYF